MIALGLQFFRAHLQGFALGFYGTESLNVQVGLGIFTGGKTGDNAVQIFAQQKNI